MTRPPLTILLAFILLLLSLVPGLSVMLTTEFGQIILLLTAVLMIVPMLLVLAGSSGARTFITVIVALGCAFMLLVPFDSNSLFPTILQVVALILLYVPQSSNWLSSRRREPGGS